MFIHMHNKYKIINVYLLLCTIFRTGMGGYIIIHF